MLNNARAAFSLNFGLRAALAVLWTKNNFKGRMLHSIVDSCLKHTHREWVFRGLVKFAR